MTYTEWVEGITGASLVGDFSTSNPSGIAPRFLVLTSSRCPFHRRLQLECEPSGRLLELNRGRSLLDVSRPCARRRPTAHPHRVRY